VRTTLQEADVVFTIGADMFTMSLYADIEPFPPGVKLVCLNIDPWEIGKNHVVDVAVLGDPKATLAELLPMLQERLGAARHADIRARIAALQHAKAEALERLQERAAEEMSKQPMSPLVMNKILAESIPEDIIIVDESITSGAALRDFLPRRHPRDYFGLKGGGIGWGLPATMGVSLAAGDRPVLGLIGDGSAMYSIQGLWTAARYGLRSIFVICNNGQYLIPQTTSACLQWSGSQTTNLHWYRSGPAGHQICRTGAGARGVCRTCRTTGRPPAGAQGGVTTTRTNAH
jgi:benzoylformate decarboxylase